MSSILSGIFTLFLCSLDCRKLFMKLSFLWCQFYTGLNERCCVFRPDFGCCAHPKAGRTTFFQPFATFFWNCFCWFQVWNHWERFKMNKKGWKLLKKSSLTSLWVRAAPKSWLKNTTELDYYLNGKIVSSHQLSCHSIFTSKESGTIPSTSFKSEQNGAIGTRLEVKRKYLIFCKQWLASAF